MSAVLCLLSFFLWLSRVWGLPHSEYAGVNVVGYTDDEVDDIVSEIFRRDSAAGAECLSPDTGHPRHLHWNDLDQFVVLDGKGCKPGLELRNGSCSSHMELAYGCSSFCQMSAFWFYSEPINLMPGKICRPGENCELKRGQSYRVEISNTESERHAYDFSLGVKPQIGASVGFKWGTGDKKNPETPGDGDKNGHGAAGGTANPADLVRRRGRRHISSAGAGYDLDDLIFGKSSDDFPVPERNPSRPSSPTSVLPSFSGQSDTYSEEARPASPELNVPANRPIPLYPNTPLGTIHEDYHEDDEALGLTSAPDRPLSPGASSIASSSSSGESEDPGSMFLSDQHEVDQWLHDYDEAKFSGGNNKGKGGGRKGWMRRSEPPVVQEKEGDNGTKGKSKWPDLDIGTPNAQLGIDFTWKWTNDWTRSYSHTVESASFTTITSKQPPGEGCGAFWAVPVGVAYCGWLALPKFPDKIQRQAIDMLRHEPNPLTTSLGVGFFKTDDGVMYNWDIGPGRCPLEYAEMYFCHAGPLITSRAQGGMGGEALQLTVWRQSDCDTGELLPTESQPMPIRDQVNFDELWKYHIRKDSRFFDPALRQQNDYSDDSIQEEDDDDEDED